MVSSYTQNFDMIERNLHDFMKSKSTVTIENYNTSSKNKAPDHQSFRVLHSSREKSIVKKTRPILRTQATDISIVSLATNADFHLTHEISTLSYQKFKNTKSTATQEPQRVHEIINLQNTLTTLHVCYRPEYIFKISSTKGN